MPYLVVSDFSAGLDLRKSEVTAPAGTLREIVNAHITPGGEIEKRKAFVELDTCDPAVFGLACVGGDNYVFKNGTSGIVVKDNHVEITIPSATANPLIALLDWDIYDGEMYLVIEDSAGVVQHFYPASKGSFYFSYINSKKAQSHAIRTYRNKVHGVKESELYFSAVDAPRDYAGTGAGFVNLASQDAESESLVALEVYYDTLAIMSKRAIQLWQVDPDPALYQQIQVLRAAGTDAPKSLKQFGSGDVLYLANSGIRSLRARDSSHAAAVSDIGSPVDEYIRSMRSVRSASYMSAGTAIIEPISNRFWMVFPNEILVLSLFPNPKVTAWSTYLPGFEIKAVSVSDDRVVLLSTDNKLYTYGAEVYDNSQAEVLTPFLNAESPATRKRFRAFDAACEGTWEIYLRMDVSNPAAEDHIATITGTTFGLDDLGVDGIATHCAVRMTTTKESAAKMAHVVLHFDKLDDG